MSKITFQKMGWISAAAIAGVLLASGFQDTSNKFAVVDIADMVEKSELGKKGKAEFAEMQKTREGLLEFIDTNRVLTNEQAQELKTLTLKPSRTADETAKIERIKAEVVAANKKWTELSTKANLTPEDRTLLNEYATRGQTMEQVARRWYQEFSRELQDWANTRNVEHAKQARAAIQEAAKAQGYTVVFDVTMAPYGANDLTNASLQAMNAKK